MTRVREAPGGTPAAKKRGGVPAPFFLSAPPQLRPQDVLVLCELAVMEDRGQDWRYADLVGVLGLSTGAAHDSVMRCLRAQLLSPSTRVARRRALDFLVLAVPIVFYAARGGFGEGVPTGAHAPGLLRGARFAVAKGAVPRVWTRSGGGTWGESVSPVYPTAPEACLREPALYELLALVDLVRIGSDRERATAAEVLGERLGVDRR